MSTQKIILFACGCFNPITIMHLRMFELARDSLSRIGGFSVIGGIISPVHDDYKKKDLAEGHHRINMTRLGTLNCEIKVSSWEMTEHTTWSRTLTVLRHHQDRVNEYMNGNLAEKSEWMPDSLSRDDAETPVKLKLLCGADVLESFNIPNLWSDDHMTEIVRDFGIVVITRVGEDPMASIDKNSIFQQYRNNIMIVVEWIINDISSSKMRAAIRNEDSIRYFVPNSVIQYIKDNNLYQNES